MSATADPPAGRTDPAQLTVLYTRNDDGWVTAQIAEFPAAISQGRTEHEAWTNVLDALHDLTHEPTTAERLAAVVQARIVEPLSGAMEPLNELLHGLAAAARDRGRERTR
jgi:predicted RNase H-like HicB family nuclease